MPNRKPKVLRCDKCNASAHHELPEKRLRLGRCLDINKCFNPLAKVLQDVLTFANARPTEAPLDNACTSAEPWIRGQTISWTFSHSDCPTCHIRTAHGDHWTSDTIFHLLGQCLHRGLQLWCKSASDTKILLFDQEYTEID